ncbi:MAG: hypothetical protein NTW04_02085, partial [Elusimicrobia bacterium]|nr:hypothetical protein [Elusimicrobiota bacterium]
MIEKVKEFLVGPKDLVGIDIGSHSIKAVWLSAGHNHCKLKAWAYAPIEVKVEASPEEKKLRIAQLLKDTLAQKKITDKNVATS